MKVAPRLWCGHTCPFSYWKTLLSCRIILMDRIPGELSTGHNYPPCQQFLNRHPGHFICVLCSCHLFLPRGGIPLRQDWLAVSIFQKQFLEHRWTPWKVADSNKMGSKIRCALGILSVRVRVQSRPCNLKALAEAGQWSATAHWKEAPVGNPQPQMWELWMGTCISRAGPHSF